MYKKDGFSALKPDKKFDNTVVNDILPLYKTSACMPRIINVQGLQKMVLQKRFLKNN